MFSDTGSSESERDFDGSDTCRGCSDEEDPEDWHGEVDGLLQDVASDEPLPEPSQHQSSIQALTTLLQWFIYILLFWQVTSKISDNGLEWFLLFMFQFLHVVGITCNSDYLCEMALMLPSSLNLLRKFVNLERDNFVKFAVCPKCSALYQLESCTRRVGGQIVSGMWSSIGKKGDLGQW